MVRINKFMFKQIFSINNEKTHKVLTIFGVKLKFKSKSVAMKSELRILQEEVKLLKHQFLGINKEKVSSNIENFKGKGCVDVERSPRLIVSLTSFPARMYDIHYALFSLLNQTVKPDKVILWLGEDKFPNKDEDLPKKVLELKKHGLSIEYCKDVRSFTKLIPALIKYPNDIIVTADDDIYYPDNWLEVLYNGHLSNNIDNNILCHRAHNIKFDNEDKIEPYSKWDKAISISYPSSINFLTGVGGVLYPPNSFSQEVFNEVKFKQLCPLADDIWFWAMAVLNNRKIKVVENAITNLTYVNPQRELGLLNEQTLISENCFNNKNDEQLKNVLNAYPELKTILLLGKKGVGC